MKQFLREIKRQLDEIKNSVSDGHFSADWIEERLDEISFEITVKLDDLDSPSSP